jgi:hypothetical protein
MANRMDIGELLTQGLFAQPEPTSIDPRATLSSTAFLRGEGLRSQEEMSQSFKKARKEMGLLTDLEEEEEELMQDVSNFNNLTLDEQEGVILGLQALGQTGLAGQLASRVGGREVEGIGQINPQFYTPESIEEFRRNARATGQKDYSLLKEVDRVASTFKIERTKDNVDAMKARSDAFQNSANLKLKTNQMRELLDSGLQTGALAKLSKGAKSFVQSLFPDADIKGLAEAEVFNAISNQLALLIRNPDSGMGLPGATSNRDLSFLIESVPNLGTSVQGNKLLLEAYDKMYQLQVDVMNEQRRILKANKGVPPVDLEEQLASYVENNFKLDDEFKQKLQGDYESYNVENLNDILIEEGYGKSIGNNDSAGKRVGVNPRGF